MATGRRRRYGLTVADVQTAVSSCIGGQNIVENIEGHERYPINVRYQRDFRDNVEKMRWVPIGIHRVRRFQSGKLRKYPSHMARP
jgi:copper/silver efflux system protein